MGQNQMGSVGNKNGSVKIQNFLEILRNSQTSPSGQIKGEEQPGRNIFAEIQAKKEIENRRIEQFQQQRTQEWNKIFSSKELQTEKKIEFIREEIQKLHKQVKKLDANITKAVMTPIVDSGIYHENFLEHIRNIIHRLGLKVNQANSWLETYQNRSKKMGIYWRMEKSKGASYTQNNERSIATSVG